MFHLQKTIKMLFRIIQAIGTKSKKEKKNIKKNGYGFGFLLIATLRHLSPEIPNHVITRN